MLQDKDSAKVGFEISTKTLLLVTGLLALLAIGVLSLSALGSASLMF